jgi:hypothetical protein
LPSYAVRDSSGFTRRKPFHKRALLRRRTTAGCRLRRSRGRAPDARRRDDDVDPLVRERPLQQRLRPRPDAERGEILGRGAGAGAPLAERAHDDHGGPELRGERQQLALALALLAG